MADEWHASANLVALVNGALSGVASGLGCLVGGYLSDRFDRKLAYVGFGLCLGACAVAMALGPRTYQAYGVFTLLYAFLAGVCFAGFSAVTFEAIGHGAAAFKYNVFAGFSNITIGSLTGSEGLAYSRWGSYGVLYADAGIAVVSALVFTAAVLLSARLANKEPAPA
jgi:MFS family permease